MTSLGTLMMLENTVSKITEEATGKTNDENNLHRLSLAYENMHNMPRILIEHLGSHVRILDISNNEFGNLDFLCEFVELTHLICDRNKITSKTVIPFLPKLELLWLNHCKISELYPWAQRLLHACPSLKYLSLMGNPVAPSFLKGRTFFEYMQYRFYIISLFPDLVHLDDKIVTVEERKEAQEMYHRPLMEKFVSRTSRNLPPCLREISEKFSEIFAPTPPFLVPQKNLII
ncbi:hypothetical protein NQ315_005240 [Exocentrus adspersus]|uniref:Uncharacterized protein n=1 Tax=Exocentrus adspersus TaxID=1586481 RepID=A0AAV8W2U2_9CUCU|nr:hypothetical protein NQ315_005240 [Exocentrus adspersus]